MLVEKSSKLDSNNIEIFTFGKYLNRSVKHIIQTDLDYIIWIKKNTNKLFSVEIENELKRIKIT